MNVATGEVKCVLAEGFEGAFLDFQAVNDVEDTGEMIWWSERPAGATSTFMTRPAS